MKRTQKIITIALTLCMLATCFVFAPCASAADTDTNLALSTASATVTSTGNVQTQSGVQKVATRAIDGDIATDAYYYGSGGPTMTVTLAEVASISKIQLYSSNKNLQAANLYTISYSVDNTNWTTTTAPTNVTIDTYKYVQTTLENAYAKYIKVKSSNPSLIINELEVYGTVSAAPFLKSLTAPTGTFVQAFDMANTSYKLQVESLTSLPELSYETFLPDAVAEVTQEPNAENNYTQIISVTRSGETTNYSVQFVEYNWALPANGTTYTSSSGVQGTYVPANVADGILSTECNIWTNAATTAKWIQADLGKVINLDKIKLVSRYNQSDYVKVSYSLNGTDWSDRLTANNKTYVDKRYHWEHNLDSAFARYIKIEGDGSQTSLIINEFEVYGAEVTDTYTISGAIKNRELSAKAIFINNEQSEIANKCYLMAVYVDGELHSVVPADKSADTVAPGSAALTSITATDLPATGNITAKVFVWSDLEKLIPVTTTPLDVNIQ